MKKTLLVFTLVLLIFSILPAAFAQETEEEEEPLVRADADLVIWAQVEQVELLQELGDAFGEEFGITVAVQEVDVFAAADTILPVAGPAGQGPDLIVGPHDKLGGLIAGGLVAPIEIANPDSFAPGALSAWNYAGDFYGIPIGFENVAFLRNVDIVPDAPETWDDVLEISRELAADNDDDFESNSYGFVRQTGDPYHFFPIQTAFGGYVFGLNEDGSYNANDVGIGNDGSLAAAELFGTMISEGLQPPGVDWELMHVMFESGQSAMMITGPWSLGRIRESGVNYAISNLPGQEQDGQPFLGVFGIYVSAFSEQQLLAGIFLNEYVATDEAMQLMYETKNQSPAWLATAATIDDADVVAFTEAGVNGLPMPSIPEMAQVWEAWGNAITLVEQGSEEPAAAFANAGDQIETLIEEAAQD
jgi:maltose-binding protein MalE